MVTLNCYFFFMFDTITILQIEEQSEVKKLKDKIARLQCKEEELLKETQELQEQNELLEFRIIELEESNDKVCIPFN